MKVFVASCMFLLLNSNAFSTGKEKKASKESYPVIEGNWISKECESFSNPDGSKTFFKRDFNFEKKDWKIHFNTFADEKCSAPMLSFLVSGIFTMKDKSKTVEGAYNTFFSMAKRTVTPVSEGAVGWLNSMKVCDKTDWKINVTHDIYEKGCKMLGAPAKKQCKGEFDLIHLKGTELYLGERTQEMCKENNWPKAAHKIALIRK